MTNLKLLIAGVPLVTVIMVGAAGAQFLARDPGVRGGGPGAGAHLAGLTASQRVFFDVGRDEFREVDGLAEGLGPRFNLDSCVGCHSQPAVGGTSPAVNPQVAVATAFGARNTVPPFITNDGPVREARFKRKADGTPDGGVHGLFVISGRNEGTPDADASGCTIRQPNFERQLATRPGPGTPPPAHSPPRTNAHQTHAAARGPIRSALRSAPPFPCASAPRRIRPRTCRAAPPRSTAAARPSA